MAKAPPDDLIDAHVSTRQCSLAIDALRAHELKKEQKQQETELLPRKEQHVWLVVSVKQMHPEKKLTPFRIPIKHPLVDPRTTPICLITKDPQREYKDLLESHGIKFISRVVGLTKLKGKFKPFEARRLLLKENGMFLTDERVLPLLPKLLGSKWFEAKKQPIPVCLTRKDLKAELERAISSTYMHQNRGTCTAIKISVISQSPGHILANLTSALPAVVSHIKGGWSNIQSLHIKTNSSVSLPVWTCSLGDEGEESRWAGMQVDDEADGDVDAASSDDDEEPPIEEKSSDAPVSTKSKVTMTADSPQTKRPKMATTPQISLPVPATLPASPPPVVDTAKKKRRKSKSAADTGASLAVPVSKEELKQKRNTNQREKKKDKVVGNVGGKSAKDIVVGKKAARG